MRGYPERHHTEYAEALERVRQDSYRDWLCLLHLADYSGGVFTLDYLIRREDLARADFTQTVTFAVN